MVAVNSTPVGRATSWADRRPQDVTSYHAAQAMLDDLRQCRPPLSGIGYGLAALWDGGALTTDPAEYRRTSRMTPERRREFMLGRRALHRALADAGLPDTPILTDDRNRPHFPRGVTGSVSHSGGLAVALAGATTRFRTVGVDLELTPLPLQAAHLVLTGQECELAAVAGNELALLAAFSAKEAAFKALDPILDGAAPHPRHILLRSVPVGFLAWPAAHPELMVRVSVHHVGTGVLTWTALARHTRFRW
jgi:enterobactin synthetase component D